MSGETKTLKQVEAARSVIRDVLGLLDTFRPYRSRETEARFVDVVMTFARPRLEEVLTELTKACYRATISPEHTTIVSKEVFEDVRMFRALVPARLTSLLKSRQQARARQRHESESEDDDAVVSEVVIAANEAVLP